MYLYTECEVEVQCEMECTVTPDGTVCAEVCVTVTIECWDVYLCVEY